MSRTVRKRGDAREDILRRVLELVAQGGADVVTHRSAAEAAGVSPGTATYHFPTRARLIEAAFELYANEFQTGLAKVLITNPLDTRGELAGFLETITSLDPAEMGPAVIENELALFRQRGAGLSGELQAWQRAMEAALSDGLERLGVARPIEGARLLLALSRGSEAEVMITGRQLADGVFRGRIEAVLDALGARRNDLPASA